MCVVCKHPTALISIKTLNSGCMATWVVTVPTFVSFGLPQSIDILK